MPKSKIKKISSTQIQHLADLARLKISKQETKKYSQELSDILGYVEKLNRVKTEKVSPTAQAVESENVFRGDLVDLDYSRKTKEGILKNPPAKQDNFFKVKTVFE